ncbi:N-acetyl-gamma-glutamyl-phosphate reductase [Candidatus Roseilinea sp. NK_OTU-006]|jgi:N-acetyl-gamma-glutamyl-phosphate reductase|uniref:N-acetyl-gamma-glutamyl-phosphate reductase n=1 Tax=Candidatus Roseilinea sp. NK_OTU-006 TaxID=2704250 RepID=UPI00145D86F5|nr:N-acetyl-gamma-glutamyl-phosphate reductase [Candidatus Roseilinea sp. NK_OTU-006]
MIKVGIFGATGYTGAELVRWLARHRRARIVFAHSESHAGAKLSEVMPCLFDLTLVAADDAPLDEVDLVFSCLPHGASAELCKRALTAGKRVVDFSADFRLRDAATYAEWYKHAHPHPELLAEAIYGLPEVYRRDIADAQLVANPGCYPTSILLGLLPLLELGALADPVIIADSKSGVSGAGRKPTQATHFVEVNESLAPYNIGHVHRHVPEIEQELNAAWQGADWRFETGDSISNPPSPISVIFSPHLLPISRGMLSMIYVRLTPEAARQDWHAIFAQRYAGEPFVRVLPKGQIATIAHAAHTNYAVLSVHPVAGMPDRLQIVSCIDNLVKGASGQAVQNMNVMFGLDECEGLQ